MPHETSSRMFNPVETLLGHSPAWLGLVFTLAANQAVGLLPVTLSARAWARQCTLLHAAWNPQPKSFLLCWQLEWLHAVPGWDVTVYFCRFLWRWMTMCKLALRFTLYLNCCTLLCSC